jgi:hypothetical protein
MIPAKIAPKSMTRCDCSPAYSPVIKGVSPSMFIPMNDISMNISSRYVAALDCSPASLRPSGDAGSSLGGTVDAAVGDPAGGAAVTAVVP